MIKKINELNKAEKLLLLEAIKKGEVDPKDLTPETLYATEHQDYFQGLMVAGNQVDDSKVTVICLSDARIARDDMIKLDCIELVEGDGTISETINFIRPNFK